MIIRGKFFVGKGGIETAICAENVTNKSLSDKRNCIRSFLLRFPERKRSRNGGLYEKKSIWVFGKCDGVFFADGINAGKKFRSSQCAKIEDKETDIDKGASEVY